jgi:hypothetical protein
MMRSKSVTEFDLNYVGHKNSISFSEYTTANQVWFESLIYILGMDQSGCKWCGLSPQNHEGSKDRQAQEP